ncbi:uncharacterized protein J4E78_010484 [Alternaria triticimaculans]|uniref:uncharacterized protein n=1 Tax=Alternaria triticimaculans TaxID=297637 RepID=UPI0020C34EF7|nr:uncharacterized protein J4E78_010484 [Alternaria triticimaculans]KAI4641008.1 hypothetical protein J4E78_010484 [Alternaria triticimaculans]
MAKLGVGYEVEIEEYTWELGTGLDSKRHSLKWSEQDSEGNGKSWSLSNFILPPDHRFSYTAEKRYLYYTPGGIDIRNQLGVSMGRRTPTATGKAKLETLPIASLSITLGSNFVSELFFYHWEKITGRKLSDVLLPGWLGGFRFSPDSRYIAASFFAQSETQRALPFPSKDLGPDSIARYVAKVRKDYLPANVGDLLWLIDRFLKWTFPHGDYKLDFIPLSCDHPDSIYQLIKNIGEEGRYRHHPHFRTFIAFSKMSDMGSDERAVPNNALVLAAEILAGQYTKKRKRAEFRFNGGVVSETRSVLMLSDDWPSYTVCQEDPEELKQDIVLISDLTDDEGCNGEEDDNVDGKDDKRK